MGICGGALRVFVAVVAAATAVIVLVVVVVAASAAVRVAPVAVAVAAPSVTVASTAAAAASALFEGVVLLLDVAEQVDAEFFGALDFARVRAAGTLSASSGWWRRKGRILTPHAGT